MFQIILLHNLSVIELQGINWYPDILLQDFWQGIHNPSSMASHPGPEAAEQTHTIIGPPCLTVGMILIKCCLSFTTPAAGFKLSTKFSCWFVSPQNSLKSSGDHWGVWYLLASMRQTFGFICFVFFGQQWRSPCSPIDAIFLSSPLLIREHQP